MCPPHFNRRRRHRSKVKENKKKKGVALLHCVFIDICVDVMYTG